MSQSSSSNVGERDGQREPTVNRENVAEETSDESEEEPTERRTDPPALPATIRNPPHAPATPATVLISRNLTADFFAKRTPVSGMTSEQKDALLQRSLELIEEKDKMITQTISNQANRQQAPSANPELKMFASSLASGVREAFASISSPHKINLNKPSTKVASEIEEMCSWLIQAENAEPDIDKRIRLIVSKSDGVILQTGDIPE